jgi:hypothetical protein
VDTANNDDVYFSDWDNGYVWKFTQVGASAGQLVLIAGIGQNGYNGDQPDATTAELNRPAHLFIHGSTLYIADEYNHRIRIVILNVTPRPLATVAGTTGTGFSGDGDLAVVSSLYYPYGMVTDSAGNLFIADQSNQRIREVLASNAKIQTVIGNGNSGYAGDGPTGGRGTTLQAAVVGGVPNYLPVTIGVNVPQSQWQIVSISGAQSGTLQPTSSSFTVAVHESNNYRMAGDTAVNLATTAPSVFTVQTNPLTISNNTTTQTFTVQTNSTPGNGQLQAQATGTSFLASTLTNTITVLPPAIPVLTIDASFSPDATATGVRNRHYVQLPTAVTGSPVTVSIVSNDGSRAGVALCDATSSQNATCTATTATGTGINISIPVGATTGYFDLVGLTSAARDTRLYDPWDVALDANNNVYVADFDNYRVRKLTAGGVLSTIAGSGSSTASLDPGGSALASGMRPSSVTVDSAGNVYVASYNGCVVYKVTSLGGISVIAGTQNVCTFANGIPGTGNLNNPEQVAIGSDGSLYIADFSNNRVRKITSAGGGVIPTNGNMTTIAGGGGTAPAAGVLATAANLGRPAGVWVDTANNDDVYFTDWDNGLVWKFTQVGASAGQLVLIAGIGTNGYNGDQADATTAQLSRPAHLFIHGSTLYIADEYNHRIRTVTLNVTPRPLTTVAGSTGTGFSGDGDLAIVSSLYYPYGMATDSAGNLYIADQSNQRIREVTASNGKISTVIGNGNFGFAGDGLSGRGVTLTAAIVTGPAYLPVTNGVDIEQSTWQVINTPASTTGPNFNFTVSQTSSLGLGPMRMNSATTFSLIPNSANILSVPATLTIANNSTTPTFGIGINSISRATNVVTVTLSSNPGVATGQVVTVSGVSDNTFNGTFTVTGSTSTTITYAQTGANATSSNGTVLTSVATTIGSGITQIIAQASPTGIAIGASTNITVTPVFTSVAPNNGVHGNTIPVTITGRNFLGATGITGPTGITASITNVSADGTTITASIVLTSGAPTGAQTLTILTPTGNLNFQFTVN